MRQSKEGKNIVILEVKMGSFLNKESFDFLFCSVGSVLKSTQNWFKK